MKQSSGEFRSENAESCLDRIFPKMRSPDERSDIQDSKPQIFETRMSLRSCGLRTERLLRVSELLRDAAIRPARQGALPESAVDLGRASNQKKRRK